MPSALRVRVAVPHYFREAEIGSEEVMAVNVHLTQPESSLLADALVAYCLKAAPLAIGFLILLRLAWNFPQIHLVAIGRYLDRDSPFRLW